MGWVYPHVTCESLHSWIIEEHWSWQPLPRFGLSRGLAALRELWDACYFGIAGASALNSMGVPLHRALLAAMALTVAISCTSPTPTPASDALRPSEVLATALAPHTATATPTPEQSAAPAPTPVPTATSTPTSEPPPAPTPTPTKTPTATPTATTVPTPTPTPQPHIVAPAAVWAGFFDRPLEEGSDTVSFAGWRTVANYESYRPFTAAEYLGSLTNPEPLMHHPSFDEPWETYGYNVGLERYVVSVVYAGSETDRVLQERLLTEVLSELSLLLRMGFLVLPSSHEHAYANKVTRVEFVDSGGFECSGRYCPGIAHRSSEQWYAEVAARLDEDELRAVIMHELLHLIVLMGHATQGIMAYGERQTLRLTEMDRAQLWLHSHPLMADVYGREEVEPLVRFGEWEEPPPPMDEARCEQVREDDVLLIKCVPSATGA